MSRLEPIETLEHCGLTINIYQDDTPDNPREWDNLGHMVCWHRRANLGDETIRTQEFHNREELEASFNARVILPLYLYEHSGMTIRTYPYHDPWDSGQVGYIYTTAETIRKEYGVKRITKEIEKKVEEVLVGEVETYDQYLTGQVYGYEVLDQRDGEDLVVDSCWGHYGMEWVTQVAKEAAEYIMKYEGKKEGT